LATIPLDPNITALDAEGSAFSAIPQDAPAKLAIEAMLEGMFAALEEKH
jgi:hypothetical protein